METRLGEAPAREDLLGRIRKVEGQARGIARMIEENRDCGEILQQLAAVRSAVHKAMVELVRAYTIECAASDRSPEEVSESLAMALSRLA
jgi:DNA-binding FrmR family transcriptional regulator